MEHKIDFDFNNDMGGLKVLPDSVSDLLPRAKTCANYIMPPVGAYDGNKNLLTDRRVTAIFHSKDYLDAN